MIGKHARVIFVVSLCVLVIAIIMAAYGFPKIVKMEIQKNIEIDASSPMYGKWVKLPMPLTFKVYVFNVTNADEVNSGEKPKLSEVGPYVYDEYRERSVMGYGENDTVKYMLKKSFVFNKKLSGDLSEDDLVTVINLSYVAAIINVYDLAPSMVGMMNEALGHFFPNLTDPFLRVSIRDFLFDGIFFNCEGDPALKLVCGKIKADKVRTMRPSDDGKGFFFSMFGHMNRTESGPYEMVRGTEDVYKLGNIISYEGKSTMDVWEDPYCGQINGSDGTINSPIDENHVPQRLYAFEAEICRSVYASFVEKTTLIEMPVYYYEISRTAFASKSAEPDNKCFCKKNWSANHDGCLLMGLLNLMPCQGAPVIASLPHFYLASEELLDYIEEGLQPNKSKHNTYVYVEPSTGVVVKGVRRLQFNIELRTFEDAPQLAKVPTGLFPVLWIDEGAELSKSLQDELRSGRTKLMYVEVARWMFLALAMIAFVACTVLLVRSGSLPMLTSFNNTVNFITPNTLSSTNGNKVF